MAFGITRGQARCEVTLISLVFRGIYIFYNFIYEDAKLQFHFHKTKKMKKKRKQGFSLPRFLTFH